MQELLTAITYPVVWLVCSHVLKIENGLAKLLISLTAAILVYVLIGIKLSHKASKKDNENQVTLFSRISNLFRRVIDVRIWLSSAVVIILILLLILTVNYASEKDMAELFSQQQLANVKNTATRLSDVFLQVEKNISLFPHFDSQFKKTTEEIDRYYKILSSDWENALTSIVLLDAKGKIKSFYPHGNLPRINILDHFKIIKKE